MCNPEDETPCVDGEPGEQATTDTRTQAQRNHEAFNAVSRSALASGALGQHNGLPVTVSVSTTLQELESGAGVAVTGGGSLVPMPTLIRMAAHSHHYLYIYDKHTKESLYLGRSRRCASPAQRIVLHARDRGCTRPGHTDIDDLTRACGPDNRMVDKTGWRTRKNTNGDTEWIAPPALDTGRRRVNGYHHPERYLLPADGDAP